MNYTADEPREERTDSKNAVSTAADQKQIGLRKRWDFTKDQQLHPKNI